MITAGNDELRLFILAAITLFVADSMLRGGYKDKSRYEKTPQPTRVPMPPAAKANPGLGITTYPAYATPGNALLSEIESEFFMKLLEAFPQFHIFPRIPFSALMHAANPKSWLKFTPKHRRMKHKVADFVVVDKHNFKVLAIIECDDQTHDGQTHDGQTEKARDAILREAGYEILRFDYRKNPTANHIRSRFNLATQGVYDS